MHCEEYNRNTVLTVNSVLCDSAIFDTIAQIWTGALSLSDSVLLMRPISFLSNRFCD